MWKISDFEMATKNPKRLSFSGRAAGCYRGPELLQGNSTCTHKSDIWSLGCILYELITKRVAFSSPSSVLECSDSKMLTLPIPRGPGDGGENLSIILASMLQIDPSRRPTARQLAVEVGWKMYRWLAKSLVGRELYAGARKAYELAIKKRSHYAHLWFLVAENLPTSIATEEIKRRRSSSSTTIVNFSALSADNETESYTPKDVSKTKLYEFACSLLSRTPDFGCGPHSVTAIEGAQARTIEAAERVILKPQNPRRSILYYSDSTLLNLLFNGDYRNALQHGNESMDENKYEYLGDIYAQMGDYTEALKMYKTALRKDPSNMSLRTSLGHAYFARAVKAQYNPTKDEYNRQPLLLRRNPEGDYKTEYSKAIKAYASVESHCGVDKGGVGTSKYIIQAYIALQHYDQALRTAKVAAKKHSHEWSVWDDLADTQDNAIRHHYFATFTLMDPRSTAVNGEGVMTRYFGLSLDDILEMEDDLIPNFVRLCINAIERKFTADPEHVYSVSGIPAEIAKLKAQWGIYLALLN